MASSFWLLMQLFQLYLFILMMRFALHFARADFYNPLVQGIIKATDWLVAPLQKILRPGRHIDPATLVAAVLFSAITSALISRLLPVSPINIVGLLIAGALGSVYMLLQMYTVALFAMILMSWVAPQPTHPAPLLIVQIIRPLMAPLQRIIPPLGGVIDLSPLVVFFGIVVAKNIVIILANYIHIIPKLIIVGLQ